MESLGKILSKEEGFEYSYMEEGVKISQKHLQVIIK